MPNFKEQEYLRCIHLQVKTDLSEIDQILQWFEQLKDEKLTHEFLLRAKIALIEGFTNAVRHAHQHRPVETPIDIEVYLCAQHLEIRVWDSGPPFDLAALLNQVEQQYPNPLEHYEHWGATIFRKLSLDYGWTIHYPSVALPQGDRNCLQIQMPL